MAVDDPLRHFTHLTSVRALKKRLKNGHFHNRRNAKCLWLSLSLILVTVKAYQSVLLVSIYDPLQLA
jgi:hypothetical protein